MANKLDNLLTPQEVNARLTPEERRRNAIKAGKASAKARKEKSDLFRAMDLIMEMPAVGKTKDMLEALGYSGAELNNGNALAATLYAMAMKGNTKAAELLLNYKLQVQENTRKNKESDARISAMAQNTDIVQINSTDDDEGGVMIYLPAKDELEDKETSDGEEVTDDAKDS